MSLKISAVEQFRKHKLLEGGNGAGIKAELVLKICHKVRWQDHISYTQCGRYCFEKVFI